jgi:hypothetical protein
VQLHNGGCDSGLFAIAFAIAYFGKWNLARKMLFSFHKELGDSYTMPYNSRVRNMTITPQNLTQLNNLADIVMWFKFNSVAKLRIAAGKPKI